MTNHEIAIGLPHEFPYGGSVFTKKSTRSSTNESGHIHFIRLTISELDQCQKDAIHPFTPSPSGEIVPL